MGDGNYEIYIGNNTLIWPGADLMKKSLTFKIAHNPPPHCSQKNRTQRICFIFLTELNELYNTNRPSSTVMNYIIIIIQIEILIYFYKISICKLNILQQLSFLYYNYHSHHTIIIPILQLSFQSYNCNSDPIIII